MQKYKNMLLAVQRKVALRIARAYRTVSTEAALVIASQVPLDILADERRRTHETGGHPTPARRTELRMESLSRWQESFAGGAKGRWTARLIGDVGKWYGRKHGEVNYFLTQFLSDHGSFGDYLVRIGKREDDSCYHCGRPDSAEHTVFQCREFEEQRTAINREIRGVLTVNNVIDTALRNRRTWDVVMGSIQEMVKRKVVGMRDMELNP